MKEQQTGARRIARELREVPPALSPARRERRKFEVLTHPTSSTTESIADAAVIKSDGLFFLCNGDGGVPLKGRHGLGLYYHDCRFLDGYEISVTPKPLHALSSTSESGDRSVFELASRGFETSRGGAVPENAIGVRVSHMVDGGRRALFTEIRFRSFASETIRFPVSLRFACSFEDVFAVRGLLKEAESPGKRGRRGRRKMSFSRRGRDGALRSVTVLFSSPRIRVVGDTARFTVSLAPRQTKSLFVSVAVNEEQGARPGKKLGTAPGAAPAQKSDPARSGAPGARPGSRIFRALERRHDALARRWEGETTRIVTDVPELNAMLDRSLRDMRILMTSFGSRRYVAAGVPWFVTLFGRDSIVSALQLLAYFPGLAAETARLLALFQGRERDAWRDEEPGRILHEVRIGEFARAGEIPHTPFYGTVDAPPLFLVLVAAQAAWSGRMDLFEELEGNVTRALDWISGPADSDGDGYIDYRSPVGRGLVNQGWKDTGDAIVTSKGGLAEPPIALVECQGYVYLAKKLIAGLFARAGDAERARALEKEAAVLKRRFNRDFWLAKERRYALALQEGGRPASVMASNAGHTLWTGIASEEHARATVKDLLAPDMFSGFGIRTLSNRERRYNPFSYHLGSVWPHDNAIIAAGFRSYGYDEEALAIFSGLFDAATTYRHFRLPELFCGFSRDDIGFPVPHPISCHPQAWAAGTIPYLLRVLLGFEAEGLERRLRIIRPLLPEMVDRVRVERLAVGEARVDLDFTRRRQKTDVRILKVEGDLDVVVE